MVNNQTRKQKVIQQNINFRVKFEGFHPTVADYVSPPAIPQWIATLWNRHLAEIFHSNVMNAAIDTSARESSVLSYYWPITQIFNTSRWKSLKVAPDLVFFLSNAVMKNSDLAWVAKNDENTHNLFFKLMEALKAFPHSLMKFWASKLWENLKSCIFSQSENRNVTEASFHRTLQCRSIHPYFRGSLALNKSSQELPSFRASLSYRKNTAKHKNIHNNNNHSI